MLCEKKQKTVSEMHVALHIFSMAEVVVADLHKLWPAGQRLVRIFSIFEDFWVSKAIRTEDWVRTED